MNVEGVHFVEEEVKKMKWASFKKMMMPIYFQDRNEEEREMMLKDIYTRIVGR